MVTGAIIGRDAEVEFVQEFLNEVGSGPAGLLPSGEAGIGKTILWEVGVQEARRQFERVLTCRGVEAEAALSFAGLSELLGDVLWGRCGLSAGAATEGAGGRAAAG